MILSEADKAYIAGCVDCDGCIQITRRNRKRNPTTQYNLDVTISNTSITLMNWLRGRIPGVGCYENNGGQRKNICYGFSLTGKGAFELLKLIEPYIVGKSKQASLGIIFGEIKGFRQGVAISNETNELLELMYQEMRALKIREPKGGVLSY